MYQAFERKTMVAIPSEIANEEKKRNISLTTNLIKLGALVSLTLRTVPGIPENKRRPYL